LSICVCLLFRKIVRLASILLWWFLIQESALTCRGLGYTLKKCDETRLMYITGTKGQVSLCNAEWKTVVYVNLNKMGH
jgi:hypothetical protein